MNSFRRGVERLFEQILFLFQFSSQKTMNKKVNTAVAIMVIIIIASTLGTLIWLSNDSENKVSAQPQINTENVKVEYKNLRVNDGTITFVFEVPIKWLTETRHSGEKQLSVEEMRDFLATNFDGDIKTNPDLYSDYYEISWSELKKMSVEEIKRTYFSDFFPNASVAAGDHIWYSDTSWKQIDFRLQNKDASDIVAEVKQEHNDYCKKYGYGIIGCGNDAPKWSKAIIDGKNVDIITYSMDKDEKGNEIISKGGTGGKVFFVEIPNLKKTLVISKQAKGDNQFENDFEYLIQTFKFEK